MVMPDPFTTIVNDLPTETLTHLEAGHVERLWRAGDLSYKLAPCQLVPYEAYRNSPQRRYVWELPRRFGKSFKLCCLVIEQALSKPNSMIHYAAQTGKQVQNIVVPNMRTILEDCPPDLMPIWKIAEGKWLWPNGSAAHMAGCEDELKADRLRGAASDLFIFDEAGFIPPLKYAVQSIALPMTMTTDGRIILASTPPLSPAHEFVGMAIEAESKDAYQHRSIHDSTRFTAKQIAEFCEEAGGEEATEWQREYLARRVVDQERAIIPEFTSRADKIVMEVERPRWIDPIVCMDVGFAPDLTGVVFSYWNRELACLVIEDELAIGSMTTDELAAGIKSKETALWGDYWAYKLKHGMIEEHEMRPHQRLSDIALQLIHDLAELHGLQFTAIHKIKGDGEHAFMEACVNQARLLVKNLQIRIHPRCKVLISHLKAGVWNKRHTSFQHMDGFGHFDMIAALVYQIRNLDRQRDPAPIVDPEHKIEQVHFAKAQAQREAKQDTAALSGLFDVLKQ